MRQLLLLLLLLLYCCSSCRCQSASESSALSDSVLPFYQVTESFLNFIQPVSSSILLQDLVSVVQNSSSNVFVSLRWDQIANRYAGSMLGFLILSCLGVVLIILVPVCGLIVCCCRVCCRRCSGERHLMERKGSGMCRIFYGILLAIFATLMLFGTVLALISNSLLTSRLQQSGNDTSMAVADAASGLESAAALLRSVPQEAKARSGPAMSQLAASVSPALTAAATLARDRLLLGVKATENLNLADQVLQYLRSSERNSSDYIAYFPMYSRSIDDLHSMLRVLQTNLSSFECPLNAITDDCNIIKSQLPGLSVTQQANRTGLHTVTDMHKFIVNLNYSLLSQQLSDLRSQLLNISQVLIGLASNRTEAAQQQLNSTTELEKIWAGAETLLNSLSSQLEALATLITSGSLRNPITQQQRSVPELIVEFETYRYYACLAIGCIASLVIACFSCGLLFGFCGTRPYEDSGCCNREIGADFLLAGTGIACTTYSVIYLLVLVLFLTGGAAETEACRFLTGRAGREGYELLDTQLNRVTKQLSPELSQFSLRIFSGLIDACNGGNTTATAALNVEQLVAASDVNTVVQQYADQLKAELLSRSPQVTQEVSLSLNLSQVEAAAANLSGQSLSQFMQELNRSLIANSARVLDAIANISLMASESQQRQRFTDLYSLSTYSVYEALWQSRQQLLRLRFLEISLEQLNSSAAGIMQNLGETYKKLQTPLNIDEAIGIGITQLTRQLKSTIIETVDRILLAAADCSSISAQLRAAIGAPCVALLRPFNGFWVGAGIYLLCLLPCLILSIKLANFYRKSQKYEPGAKYLK